MDRKDPAEVMILWVSGETKRQLKGVRGSWGGAGGGLGKGGWERGEGGRPQGGGEGRIAGEG